MGIYPEITYEAFGLQNQGPDGEPLLSCTRFIVRRIETPGLVVWQWAELVNQSEQRDNCFCCSCPEDVGADPYCRNHGWIGTRPCEEHKMEGQATEEGEMPLSVQKKREWEAQIRNGS